MNPSPRRIGRGKLFLPALLLLVGCSGGGDDASAGLETGVPSDAASATPSDTAPRPVASSADSAVAVLRAYYTAIDEGDYERAHRLWASGGEASGQTLEEFREGFARTATSAVTLGTPGRIEGAVGSRFIEVPAVVNATLQGGEEQCFRGSYTLVRSVVDGATAEQRSWRIRSATLRSCAADAAASPPAPADVALLVESFGDAMDRVQLLAPTDTLRAQIRTVYGPLVTRDLLDRWLADPSSVPGRGTSSPWPDRIEVDDVRPAGNGSYEVNARVVYVSSPDLGGDGEPTRETVAIEVTRDAAGEPRIANFEAERPD